MFVTALLGEDRSDEKLARLRQHGPVGQARYLRLVPEVVRDPAPRDAIAFGLAVQALCDTSAECIVTEDWTAWRYSDVPGSSEPEQVEQWLATGDVTFLPRNAFRSRTPIDVATIEALSRFKDFVVGHRPNEDRFDRIAAAELRGLRGLPREDLNDLILQAALDWRREWRDQAAAMGLATLLETAIGDGDPHVTVYEEWPDPGVRIEWGETAGVTWIRPADDRGWGFRPLSHLLEPGRSARVYHELVERAERAIGCRFGSRAWRRPEHVAAWAW